MENVFNSMMEFKTTEFKNFFKATNASLDCYIEYVATIGWVASYEDLNNLKHCDEKSFTAPSDCVRWLETKVPFSIKFEEV